MNKFNTNKLFLTFFYVGYIKPAPGTWGSLAGLVVGFFVAKFIGLETLFLLAILICLIAINSINTYEKNGGNHDDSNIVIDEVVGIWIAQSITLCLNENSYLALILSFVFFRGFDIFKPSIIGRIDRNVKGGLGVMLDDVLAGFFAGLLALMVMGGMIKFGFEKYIF
ncbi:phosphatidylglycerophosphatase A [Campylobacter sp. FMV-PI01]|uniref:Phosphatidylglycerophosphatase A n=1 Tax=Campylobacter portucalensis TaxID=2608384 RepID=A0A6L5WGT1_9BACT|nr:phosphatidylglycerophosphatase A [Campylobacter portucalensis]MSN96390.1 phosphatidylglycerophosphatase A [Campylobacter portucalensis]